MLSNIRIVLVETSHPGNIGAAARAMKNMTMDQLYLVSPKIFPSADATARAAGADHILGSAKICQDLSEAVADCHLVVGTSARPRTLNWPLYSPRSLATELSTKTDIKTAIVFGRENSGLSNEELNQCQYLLQIPCNDSFSSLNIAAAVQVMVYELFIISQKDSPPSKIKSKNDWLPATSVQLEQFFEHLQQTLLEINFLQPGQSKSMMQRLRRLFHKSQLDSKEVDIMRGILSAAGNKKQRQSTDQDYNKTHDKSFQRRHSVRIRTRPGGAIGTRSHYRLPRCTCYCCSPCQSLSVVFWFQVVGQNEFTYCSLVYGD